MKKLFILTVFAIVFTSVDAQSILEAKVKGLSNDSIAFNQFAGKKTLFIVVPLSQSDAVFQQLQAFKARYGDTVHIVGIVSKEDGYLETQKEAVLNLYNVTGILLTEAMYTRKTAGTNQSVLMQWLTNKDKNHHFNNDATGIGSKFFISETGRLFAVLPPQASLQMPMIDKIVHSGTAVNQ